MVSVVPASRLERVGLVVTRKVKRKPERVVVKLPVVRLSSVKVPSPVVTFFGYAPIKPKRFVKKKKSGVSLL